MARSTVVNLAVGLEQGGFKGSFAEMRKMIKKVGLEVAKQHIKYVHHDYQAGNIGQVRGLLSLKQMADYHHDAFRKFNIPSSFYGGLGLIMYLMMPNSNSMVTYIVMTVIVLVIIKGLLND